MSRKVSLPGENWALLRDPKDIPERLRRPILQQMPSLASADPQQIDAESIGGMFGLRDALAVAFVQEWSFDGPVTTDTVLDLPSSIYDALAEEIAPEIAALITPPSPQDPKSPTHASPPSATG